MNIKLKFYLRKLFGRNVFLWFSVFLIGKGMLWGNNDGENHNEGE